MKYKDFSISSEGISYVYFPSDSYHKRTELKKAGFRFHPILKWHSDKIIEGYEDMVVSVSLRTIMEYFLNEEDYKFLPEAASVVKSAIDSMQRSTEPVLESEWVEEEIGERIKKVSARLIKIHKYQGAYGLSSIVLFEYKGSVLKWFTQCNIEANIGDTITLSATVKEKIIDSYEHDIPVTVVTRCKVA